MMNQTEQNEALTSAVRDLVAARPDSVSGRIVFVLDDVDDEHLRRVTEASGKVNAEFLSHFVAAVTAHFASVLTENGMPTYVAAISLMSAAKSGIDSALGNNDDDDDDEVADEDAIQ